MKKCKIILILLILLTAVPIHYGTMKLYAQEKDCCNPEPPSSRSTDTPGNDHADERFSYSEANNTVFKLAPEAVVLTRGFWEYAKRLFGGLISDGDNTAQKLFAVTPFIVLPAGSLFGLENDTTFKYMLEQYVAMGGTVIIFAQQFGSQIDHVVPVPQGERLESIGWREDSSCFLDSSYPESIHPILSSWIGGVGTIQTDGYFKTYPSSSTIYLRRSKNRYPLLLSYR